MCARTGPRATMLGLGLLTLAACGEDSAGEGELEVTVYGEAFIEDGIDASEMADDWSVRFDSFEVEVDGVSIGGADVEVDPRVELSEASDGQGHPVGSALLPAGSYTDASFSLGHVSVRGQATKDGTVKTFAWDFATTTHYDECETTTVVNADGAAGFEITVHADHLFYDSAVAEEPRLRFEPLAAADADDDGEITQAELSAADIGSYDAGSSGDVDSLWAYLELQVGTLGHVDGEGHCHAHAAD